MQPHILMERLSSHFMLPDQILLLILNFLTNRLQQVFVNGHMSSVLPSNTGSPQDYVLSPLLFILYTDSCRSSHEYSCLVKFSDDTVLLSLLQGHQSNHNCALPEFVRWCEDSFLDLNVSKTKEIIIDFRKSSVYPKPSTIHGEKVQIVQTYKYLGTVFDSQLKFSKNTDSIVKRANQRSHLLRKLNSFDISRNILRTFYQTFIESLLTFSFICWFGGLSVKDKKCLNDIIRVCSKITGVQLKDLCSLWKTRVIQKADSILSHPDHVLGSEFVIMPSGRWYYVPVRKTNRYANSIIPSAIRLLNAQLQDEM